MQFWYTFRVRAQRKVETVVTYNYFYLITYIKMALI